MYPLILARQRFGEHVPAAMNTCNNRRTAGSVVFYAVRVVSKESVWVCLYIALPLLCNGSINMFLRQQRTVGGAVFYTVRVPSKESRRLTFPRTSFCYNYCSPQLEVNGTHLFDPCEVTDKFSEHFN
jgi:hypothetical protein